MTHFFDRRWIRKLLVVVVVAGMVTQTRAAAPPQASAEDPNASSDPVEKAIRGAVDFLYKSQKGDNWEESPRRNGNDNASVSGMQWGGLTSMAVYGLLAAGENSQNPKVAAGLSFLDKADVIGTYAMGMKLQSWNYVERPTAAQKAVIRKDATLLMGGVNAAGASKGLYHYSTTADGSYDISCSNYGVLGMWAAAQQNLEVPTAYWKLVDEAWRKEQNKDGGWEYMNGGGNGAGPSTLPMTAAGVATLFITQEMINASLGECKGNIVDKDMDRGLEWLSRNYGGLGNLYAMYNIERVGTASGYKYFGTVDWYKQGADFLIKSQKPDGSWDPGGHGNAITGTVWGLLFLVKGRAPVMMNKLEYTIDTHGDKGHTNWNQRPRDIANLARWAGKQLEKELNWQIVNLKVDIEDLHDAPILYMSGNQNLALTKEEKAKLKQYIEGGGMILGHADCNDGNFKNSFSKLGQELFPMYEFRELPQDHPVYSTGTKTWNGRPPILRGLSNGARELMILIPAGDPARYWQIQNFSSANTRPLAELATNIFLYACDKDTLKGKFKGQSYIVKRDEKAPAVKTVKIARLEYGGNWNPEPGGWRRLANLMHNTRATDLVVETVKLGTGKLSNDYQVAHLTGTVRFKLADSQRAELKAFVAGGGTLVVDAAGGAGDFKDAIEAEFTTDFGKSAPLAADHPAYTAAGDDLARAFYRGYTRKLLVGATTSPRLRGIQVNNRTAVIYSPEDLSVGLVGMSIDGIYGYEPSYATKLMQSVIFFASGGPPPKPVAQPAQAADKPKPEDKKSEEKKMEPVKPGPAKPAPAAKKPMVKK